MQTATSLPQNWQEILLERDTIIADLELKLEVALHQLAHLRKLFKGSKTERFAPPVEQLSIFGDLSVQPHVEPETQTITRRLPKKKEKQQPIRKLLPAHLPREITTVEPEGIDIGSATKIGQEITEVLEYKPGTFFVSQIIRPKYKTGDTQEGKTCIQIASIPASLQPIAKSNVVPGLLSYILISKYEDHLPLHRQRKMFLRDKIDIPESTIGNWVKQGLNLLEPLFENNLKSIKKAGYQMVDESPIPVLESAKKGATHKGYYWVYYDPINHNIAFQYHKSRAGDAPKEFLQDFKGYLQTDAYGGYDQFEQNKDIIQLCCLAHIRRKFHESLQNEEVRATHALELIGSLYDIEWEARDKKFSADERKALRDEKARPILKLFQDWLKAQIIVVLPKSAIKGAIAYTLNLWPRLENYLLDGRLEIDNNWIENKIRPLAIGRKNYLFAGSHEAAARAGMIYSFLAMCRVAEVNPTDWLKDVLGRIQDHPINKISELLPHN